MVTATSKDGQTSTAKISYTVRRNRYGVSPAQALSGVSHNNALDLGDLEHGPGLDELGRMRR